MAMPSPSDPRFSALFGCSKTDSIRFTRSTFTVLIHSHQNRPNPRSRLKSSKPSYGGGFFSPNKEFSKQRLKKFHAATGGGDKGRGGCGGGGDNNEGEDESEEEEEEEGQKMKFTLRMWMKSIIIEILIPISLIWVIGWKAELDDARYYLRRELRQALKSKSEIREEVMKRREIDQKFVSTFVIKRWAFCVYRIGEDDIDACEVDKCGEHDFGSFIIKTNYFIYPSIFLFGKK